jgi:hypothetical protein
MPLSEVALVVSIANGCAALILMIGRISDRYRGRRRERPKRRR